MADTTLYVFETAIRQHLDFLCKKKDIETIALALVFQNRALSVKPMTQIKKYSF
jgi:hypothetical protein